MSQPWFTAVERFGRADGDAWANYIDFSKLTQVVELVSLDGSLCAPVLREIRDYYWPYIVNEDFCLNFFTDLGFLRQELASQEIIGARLLCVYRNPEKHPTVPPELSKFCFFGFDLVEADSATSALCNCGGWPELEKSELSKWGLVTDHERALELQITLRKNHPEEPHANCDVWAIFAELE